MAKRKQIFWSSLLLFYFIRSALSDNSYFEKHEFHKMEGNSIETSEVYDDFQCMLNCKRTEECSSINLADQPNKDGLYECVLLRREAKKYSGSMNPSSSHHHYTRVGGKCDAPRCMNGGRCEDMVNDFRCNCLIGFTGKLCETKLILKNCAEVLKFGGIESDVYTVDPDGEGGYKVYCDQKTNGGGWTVIQKRQDGSVKFYRGWNDYKNGFGNLTGEFWLGLDKIYRLTIQTRNRLRVELEDWENNTNSTVYAEYDYFAVTDEKDNYTLSLGIYEGTAGDSLSWHRGMAFTTKDRDNDKRGHSNCAVTYKGAWWYHYCHQSNLNGLYHHGKHESDDDGINWYHWKGYHYSAKRAEMKIRPV